MIGKLKIIHAKAAKRFASLALFFLFLCVKQGFKCYPMHASASYKDPQYFQQLRLVVQGEFGGSIELVDPSF